MAGTPLSAAFIGRCFVILPLLLALGNESMAETNYRDMPVLTLRAQLYIKIGDYYAARQEYERAAAAYQKAAELSVENLPPEEQVAISERLVNVRDIKPAIENLQRIRREQPANLNARLMLARYLAWDNQPRAAVQVADEVLALDPDNITAKTIKATVSGWRSDYATAVPLFEEVLQQEENFDTRLDYYHALANLGNHLWASDVTAQFTPENEFQTQALEDLDWTMMRKSSPNLQYRQEHYYDSLENGRTTQSLRLEQPWRNNMTYLAIGNSVVNDGYGYSFDLSMFETGLKGTLSNSTHASAAVGMSRYDHFDTENVRTARLQLEHTQPDLQLGAEFRREAYDDFTYIVFNQIKTNKSKLQLDYHPSDFWNLKLDYLHTNYSDDNRSQEMGLAYRYAIQHTPPRITVGYKIERLSFKTQTFHGYYDPDHSGANKVLLQIYKGGNRYEWGIEGFFGHQDTRRLGLTQEDSIAGWESFFRVHWLKNLYLEASWEGANYGINKPYLYRYHLFNVRAMVMY